MKVLLDYHFNSLRVENPDHSFPVNLTHVTVEGDGRQPQTVDFGDGGKGVVHLDGLQPDLSQFCLHVLFCANGPITVRQHLVESDRLPFGLYLEPGTNRNEFIAVASVNAAPVTIGEAVAAEVGVGGFPHPVSLPPMPMTTIGWESATTRFSKALTPGVWYSLDLIYDFDTLGIAVDGTLVAVQAFPDGRTQESGGHDLLIGAGAGSGAGDFRGRIAELQFCAGIPEELERQLDERRSQPEWFISYRRVTAGLGAPNSPVTFDVATGGYCQAHQDGAILYHDSVGAAFLIHDAIYSMYSNYSRKEELGFLISDESLLPQQYGRKAVFSRGAIYWSPTWGAIPITDRIYLAFESLGGVDRLGFPTREAATVPGGVEQEFREGRMYCRAGALTAREVHGDILAKFLQSGGITKWGFPISDESAVMKNGHEIGRVSEFENCTIYWSGAVGAHELHGDIRAHYRKIGGPGSDLGLPTSDELDIPDEAGSGKFNTFENGSLCWYGDAASIVHVRPFTIFLSRVETWESEKALFAGQNDIYLHLSVDVGGQAVYAQRHPESGDWEGHNMVDPEIAIPIVIIPNDPSNLVTLTVDVWDSDDGAEGSDDHLGTYTAVLGPQNAWGLRWNQGIMNSGSIEKIRDILWSVKPQADVSKMSEPEKFWGVKNRPTPEVSYESFAAAFRNVDSEAESWDVLDWLDRLYYELVVKGLASHGNCFGMCLEAIYARKGRSRYGLPLNRFTDWGTLETDFNVRHCYQVGASTIWYFLEQVLSGNTHDPTDVFGASRSAYQRGCDPILGLTQDYAFSGNPHALLAVPPWDASSKPWTIPVCDPNFPNELRQVEIDPDTNTFRYQGQHDYEGSEWTGGRFFQIPFNEVDGRPRTPVWDAILLLIAGTIVILSGAETEALTGGNGADLDAAGMAARERLRQGGKLDGFFVRFPGVGGSVPAELLVQKGSTPAAAADLLSTATHRLVGELVKERGGRRIAEALRDQPRLFRAVTDRTVAHVLADDRLVAQMTPAVLGLFKMLGEANRATDFIHGVTGRQDGELRYVVKRSLSAVELRSPIVTSERDTIGMRGIGGSQWTMAMSASRDKAAELSFRSRLGAGSDHIKTTVRNLPVAGSQGFEINLRPGLGGLDFVSRAGQFDMPCTLQGYVGGTNIEREFVVPVDGGVRLDISSLLTQGDLIAGRIVRLFGQAFDRRILRQQ